MVHIPYDLIMSKISEETELSADDIEKRVQRKMQELSGLLSPEGAAHIIANELGVDILPPAGSPIKIGEVLDGMRNITLHARILQVYDMREFERDGSKGRVQSLLIGDETGRMRATFWHDAVEKLKTFHVDDVIEIKDVLARNNQGRIELSANERTRVKKSNATIASIADVKDAPQAWIKNVTAQQGSATLLGVVVQMFRPNFYEVCSECQRRAKDGKCADHPDAEPRWAYVCNGMIDDGTGVMRIVCFREQALSLLGISHEDLVAMREDQESLDTLRESALGHYIKMTGRITHNRMFSRTEMVANSIEKDFDVAAQIHSVSTN